MEHKFINEEHFTTILQTIIEYFLCIAQLIEHDCFCSIQLVMHRVNRHSLMLYPVFYTFLLMYKNPNNIVYTQRNILIPYQYNLGMTITLHNQSP